MEELFSKNQQMKEQQRILTDNIKTLENRWAFPPLIHTALLLLRHMMTKARTDHLLIRLGQIIYKNISRPRYESAAQTIYCRYVTALKKMNLGGSDR